jgi:hypothetical protein
MTYAPTEDLRLLKSWNWCFKNRYEVVRLLQLTDGGSMVFECRIQSISLTVRSLNDVRRMVKLPQY